MTSASAGFLFAEKIYDEGSPSVESGQSENCGFDRRGARDGVKTDKGAPNGGTATMMEDDHLFVGVVMQLL